MKVHGRLFDPSSPLNSILAHETARQIGMSSTTEPLNGQQSQRGKVSTQPVTKLNHEDDSDTESIDEFHDARFPPEEEAALVAESNAQKSSANNLFTSSRYGEALQTYDQALATCPNYLDYEIAVLQSNISACHLKLSEWKEAVEAATRSLDRLEAIDPLPKPKGSKKKPGVVGEKSGKNNVNGNGPSADDEAENDTEANDTIVELPSDSEDESAALEKLTLSDTRKAEVNRIRSKALLRRSRANTALNTWSSLTAAVEDYTLLASPSLLPSLPVSDAKTVRNALRDLPAQTKVAQEKEMADMMGKLKDLGNGILKPFGLSTENFKFVQDPATGGYSMNFQQ